MLQIVASLTDDSGGVIYDHNMFIVQATGGGFQYFWKICSLRVASRGRNPYPEQAVTVTENFVKQMLQGFLNIGGACCKLFWIWPLFLLLGMYDHISQCQI